MDKSIQLSLLTNHSPRFKPWAMEIREIIQNRFNGLLNSSMRNNKNKIDQLVYQLYELTEEEIAIVEGSTK